MIRRKALVFLRFDFFVIQNTMFPVTVGVIERVRKEDERMYSQRDKSNAKTNKQTNKQKQKITHKIQMLD